MSVDKIAVCGCGYLRSSGIEDGAFEACPEYERECDKMVAKMRAVNKRKAYARIRAEWDAWRARHLGSKFG